jgi:hypothetical protein
VLVSVRFGGLFRVDAENKDVHDWVMTLGLATKFNFFHTRFLNSSRVSINSIESSIDQESIS